MLAPDEARVLLDTIGVTTPVGLRDRALIGLMVYSFGRISAATAMRVQDVKARTTGYGCGCTRKKGGGARSTTCLPITISRSNWWPI